MKFIAGFLAILAPAGVALAHPHAEAVGLVHFLTQPDHFAPMVLLGLVIGAAVVLRRRSARR